MEENKQEEVLKVILDRMNQEDVWFTSKEDDVYGSAKNLFKLDEYGDLNDKSKERLLEEVEDLLGDGATYLIEAVDQWIQDNLIQGTISYKDNLHMNYTPKEISEEVTAYQEKGVEDLELGTLDEKGKEKKVEGYKVTSYYDNKYRGIEDSLETEDVSDKENFIWDKVQKGNYVEEVNTETGDTKRYTPDNIETAGGVEDLLECSKITEGTDEDLEKEYGMGWAQLPMPYLNNLYDFVSEWYEEDPDEFEDISPEDVLNYFKDEYELDDEDIEDYEEWYLTYAQHILNQVMKSKTESKKLNESDEEATFEVRTKFRIDVSGYNTMGSEYYDNDDADSMLDRYPEIDPDVLFDKANKMLKGEDLAEYLPDTLKGVIHSITLHFEYTELVAVIKADKSFDSNDELKEELADYLQGQYSDGWGEGFEQRPIIKIDGFEDDQYEQVEADVFISPMLRFGKARVSLAEKKTLKSSKEIGRKKVVEVITDPNLGKNGLPKLPDPYEMQYRFQDDLYQIVNKGPEGIDGYCYAVSDDDSYTGTWGIYGKSDDGIIDYEENVEDYNECVKLMSKFDDIALQESKKLKSTLTESSDTSKRKRLNEENQKSADLISNALSAKDFDIESPAGQIVSRTSELFNVLSDKQYDVQVTFDNGESQSAILLGNQGGKVIITITNGNEPLKAFASGNFELTEENFEILKDIQEQIRVI